MTIRLRRKLLAWAPLVLLAALILGLFLRPSGTALERIQARGELVVVTRPSLTTVYGDENGSTGMEYELARGFAERLGVELRLLEADDLETVHKLLLAGKADFAAAGLVITEQRRQQLRLTTPYQKVDTLVMYRLGEPRPNTLADLDGKSVAVVSGSSNADLLEQARAAQPELKLDVYTGTNVEQTLARVEEGEADYALINSNDYAIHRALFPDLAAGFTVGADQGLAWAFAPGSDGSLYQAAQRYLTQQNAIGATEQLAKRFYGHVERFDLYSARSFIRHLDDRLPDYTNAFRDAAEDAGFDWRLLAAVAYQESLWDAGAISPTGVQGLMMLTNQTAREMGVTDRTDPAQSIHAGAAYLRKLHDRMPERIAEPDRTWLALAAYNVGFGHLEDARVLTQKQGGDPDRWQDVKQRLPMLAKPAYAGQLRYGPARGGQAVAYVRHVRGYYDLLVWAENSERHRPTLVATAE